MSLTTMMIPMTDNVEQNYAPRTMQLLALLLETSMVFSFLTQNLQQQSFLPTVSNRLPIASIPRVAYYTYFFCSQQPCKDMKNCCAPSFTRCDASFSSSTVFICFPNTSYSYSMMLKANVKYCRMRHKNVVCDKKHVSKNCAEFVDFSTLHRVVIFKAQIPNAGLSSFSFVNEIFI